MGMTIDEENKIEFNIQKFLDEDCKEENEVGIKMTFSILSKAWKKGVEEGFNHGYARGSICLDSRIQNLSDDYLNRVSDAYHTGYVKGQKDFLKALMWYNKIFMGHTQNFEYDIDKIMRLYKKYKGE